MAKYVDIEAVASGITFLAIDSHTGIPYLRYKSLEDIPLDIPKEKAKMHTPKLPNKDGEIISHYRVGFNDVDMTLLNIEHKLGTYGPEFNLRFIDNDDNKEYILSMEAKSFASIDILMCILSGRTNKFFIKFSKYPSVFKNGIAIQSRAKPLIYNYGNVEINPVFNAAFYEPKWNSYINIMFADDCTPQQLQQAYSELYVPYSKRIILKDILPTTKTFLDMWEAFLIKTIGSGLPSVNAALAIASGVAPQTDNAVEAAATAPQISAPPPVVIKTAEEVAIEHAIEVQRDEEQRQYQAAAVAAEKTRREAAEAKKAAELAAAAQPKPVALANNGQSAGDDLPF